ncbi:hypothetical protein KY325_02900 [Candidatus Woesearchaeota archaeon]|nr:hypothetical protein [Candidatus Woesearchaeota archaeon]
MYPKEFPQFYGKITYVAGIVERDKITYTIVDYVKPGQEPQWQEITDYLSDIPREEPEERKSIMIPRRLDPSVILNSEVRARVIKNPKENNMFYELEIMQSAEPKHKGFKYQKYFTPEEDINLDDLED